MFHVDMTRRWAFWRRVQYGTGAGVILASLLTVSYFKFFYAPPSCSDGKQNSDERGVDCGGICTRVCAFDAHAPTVQWAQSFRVVQGQYNAVAYVQNKNAGLGASALGYTFTLYDEKGGLITSRTGTTFLPPDGIYPIFEGRIDVGARIPVRTFLELTPVNTWQEAESGRKQFEVRSRVLSGADSLPRLETVIYNTSIQNETSMAVVATIFDVRGKALTSSQSVVPLFQNHQEQKVVFTWPEPIAKTLRSCEVPTDVLLAIDLSGSMDNDGGKPPEPISSALTAAGSFVGLLRKQDQVGVVTYATTAKLAQALSRAHEATQGVIHALSIDPKEQKGQTNIGDAIAQARTEFSSSRHSADARKVLVVLTDGKANAPGKTGEAYALEQAMAARDAGITIFTVGLGAEVNGTFLTSIAADEQHRYLAPSVTTLGTIYRSISTALCEEGAAVIDVVPRPPLRTEAAK